MIAKQREVRYDYGMKPALRAHLSEAEKTNIYLQLHSVLTAADQTIAERFIAEMLDADEKLLLAKRLGILVLLIEGYAPATIADLLEVSEAEAESLLQKASTGKLAHTIELLGKNPQNYYELLTAVDTLLQLGGTLPHQNGVQRFNT